MTSLVELQGVELAYPIYSLRAQSIRNAVANLAVGGKLLRDGHDVIHVKALNGISFHLEDGDRLGIIGHNGAGKTTLLKVLAGVYEPDRGYVNVNGKVSSMINTSLGMDQSFTGRENIINMGRIRGYTARQIQAKMDEIINFTELGQFIDLPVKTYSSGMITRLTFGVATALEPDILIMDEWIGAGDKSFFEKASSRLNSVLSQSRIIILATHNFSLINRLCNKLLVLEGGKQVWFGPLAEWDEPNNRPKTGEEVALPARDDTARLAAKREAKRANAVAAKQAAKRAAATAAKAVQKSAIKIGINKPSK